MGFLARRGISLYIQNSRESALPHALSFGVHFLFFLFLLLLSQYRTPTFEDTSLLIQLESKTQRQMVWSHDGEETKESDPKAFLGEKNRKVEKQTVSKLVSETIGQPKPRAPSIKRVSPLARLGVSVIPKANEAIDEKGEKGRDTPEYVDFQIAHGSVSQDYVTGVEEGKHTALNTREYVYFSYFERIRGRLNQAWRPLLRDHILKMYRYGRQLASEMDYITKTVVTLNKMGEVIRVQVLEESGTRDLDQAAVGAFNQAGPFPNPPKDLLEKDGQVQIRWDFILKT